MTTVNDCKTAYDVQDACNLGGVLRTWSEIIPRIWADVHFEGTGTMGFRTHPINVMFASKVESLTACNDTDVFHRAYDAIVDRIYGKRI